MYTSCTETQSILKTKGFLKTSELVNCNREVCYTQTSKLVHRDSNFKVIFLFLSTLTQHSMITALSEVNLFLRRSTIIVYYSNLHINSYHWQD